MKDMEENPFFARCNAQMSRHCISLYSESRFLISDSPDKLHHLSMYMIIQSKYAYRHHAVLSIDFTHPNSSFMITPVVLLVRLRLKQSWNI